MSSPSFAARGRTLATPRYIAFDVEPTPLPSVPTLLRRGGLPFLGYALLIGLGVATVWFCRSPAAR